MTLQERVDSDLKEAMRAKDTRKLGVLRMLKSALKYAAIAKSGSDAELSDTETAQVVRKQAKVVRETIAETGATSKAQMGGVMKALQAKVAGRADGKTLSQEVSRQLS